MKVCTTLYSAMVIMLHRIFCQFRSAYVIGIDMKVHTVLMMLVDFKLETTSRQHRKEGYSKSLLADNSNERPNISNAGVY